MDIDKNYLLVIVLFIILYDIYLQYNKEIKINKSKKNVKISYSEDTPATSFLSGDFSKRHDDQLVDTTKFIESNKLIYEDEVLPTNNNSIDPNMFGKPSHIEENKYIEWEYYENNPWSKIIYYYNKEYPFYFYIKIKIPSLNDYENWKNIIVNIDFDPKTGEIIIPTKDEESALSIANLIILNFKGELSLNEIVKKDLIGTSITTARKSENVKNNIKEQIIDNIITKNIKEVSELSPKSSSIKSSKSSSITKSSNEYIPWEGAEFSFI